MASAENTGTEGGFTIFPSFPSTENLKLKETSASERKIEIHKKRSETKKILAKTAVNGIDNLDSIFGFLQGVSLICIAEFAKRGEVLNIILFSLTYILFYLIKIRMPQGSFTRVAKSSGGQIRSKLVEISTTFIR